MAWCSIGLRLLRSGRPAPTQKPMQNPDLLPPRIVLRGAPDHWRPIVEVLRRVDACGNGESPLDLGLVTSITADADEATVLVIPSSPVCCAAEVLLGTVFETLAQAMQGRLDLYVLPDRSTLWSPGRMDPAARARWHARGAAGGLAGVPSR